MINQRKESVLLLVDALADFNRITKEHQKATMRLGLAETKLNQLEVRLNHEPLFCRKSSSTFFSQTANMDLKDELNKAKADERDKLQEKKRVDADFKSTKEQFRAKVSALKAEGKYENTRVIPRINIIFLLATNMFALSDHENSYRYQCRNCLLLSRQSPRRQSQDHVADK